MSHKIVDLIVHETNPKADEVIQAWNEANPICKSKERQPADETEMHVCFGLLLFSGEFHSNNIQTKDLGILGIL